MMLAHRSNRRCGSNATHVLPRSNSSSGEQIEHAFDGQRLAPGLAVGARDARREAAVAPLGDVVEVGAGIGVGSRHEQGERRLGPHHLVPPPAEHHLVGLDLLEGVQLAQRPEAPRARLPAFVPHEAVLRVAGRSLAEAVHHLVHGARPDGLLHLGLPEAELREQPLGDRPCTLRVARVGVLARLEREAEPRPVGAGREAHVGGYTAGEDAVLVQPRDEPRDPEPSGDRGVPLVVAEHQEGGGGTARAVQVEHRIAGQEQRRQLECAAFLVAQRLRRLALQPLHGHHVPQPVEVAPRDGVPRVARARPPRWRGW